MIRVLIALLLALGVASTLAADTRSIRGRGGRVTAIVDDEGAASPHTKKAGSLTQTAAAITPDPTYDHQDTTYNATIQGVQLENAPMTLTPFFSPDHSIDVLTELVASAQTTLDIGTPGWSSWIGCTNWASGQNDGCKVEVQRNNETFPIWSAVLNAAHRGVKVRVLTNNYNQPPSQGLIDPLQFLALTPNVEVRYFKTVTFFHAKYIQADRKRASVSSVNFSKTSFMKNREAGMLIEGEGGQPIRDFLTKTFDVDWNNADPHIQNQVYTPEQMKIILDTTEVPITIPKPWYFEGAYKSPLTPVNVNADTLVFASPDNAHREVWGGFDSTKKSLQVFIYQITNYDFCDKLLRMHQSGIDVDILVSVNIYGQTDWEHAQQCYKNLTDAGLRIQVTNKAMYSYSHQKYWILDDERVFMSTGNWGQSDFPYLPPQEFPPYNTTSGPNPAWRQTNRDFNVMSNDPTIVSIFKKVRDEDHARGEPWYPETQPHQSGPSP